MCIMRPALLYLNVHVLKVFYEQINYYYYYLICVICSWCYNFDYFKNAASSEQR